MTLSARAVAAEIRRHLPATGDVKLHKLLYYSQGHHLAATGEVLFSDTISAWDMGPVVGSLYYAEKNRIPEDGAPADASLTEAQLNTIGYVLSRYGGMTGVDLQRLSHGEAPWADADRGRPAGTSRKIETEAIRSHFLTAQPDNDGDIPLDQSMLEDLSHDSPLRLERPAKVDTLQALRERRAQLTA